MSKLIHSCVYRFQLNHQMDFHNTPYGMVFLQDNIQRLTKPEARFAIVAVYKQDVPVSFAAMMGKELEIIIL